MPTPYTMHPTNCQTAFENNIGNIETTSMGQGVNFVFATLVLAIFVPFLVHMKVLCALTGGTRG